ncbi:hypothetical protein AZ09_14630 [Acetobacter aceti 1023]|nr:hypothetical protein AZ09_14630 [Acetobacter aceti 1023]
MVLLFLQNHAGCTVTKFRRKTLRFVTHEFFLPHGSCCLHKTRGNSISVSSQADSEHADIAREKQELATGWEGEVTELAGIYQKRGLDGDLSRLSFSPARPDAFPRQGLLCRQPPTLCSPDRDPVLLLSVPGILLMTITIYHSPACGTSRNMLALIRNSGEEPWIIEYLKAHRTAVSLLKKGLFPAISDGQKAA